MLNSNKLETRFIAYGFHKYSVDFRKFFPQVVKMITLQFLLKLVTIKGSELLLLDVKMAFLHGDQDQEIYMDRP